MDADCRPARSANPQLSPARSTPMVDEIAGQCDGDAFLLPACHLTERPQRLLSEADSMLRSFNFTEQD